MKARVNAKALLAKLRPALDFLTGRRQDEQQPRRRGSASSAS